MAVLSGFTNAVPFGIHEFQHYVEPRAEEVAVLEAAAPRKRRPPRRHPPARTPPAVKRPAEEGADGAEDEHATGCGHDGPGRGRLLLPGHQPRRVQVVEGGAVARHRRRLARRSPGSSAWRCTPAGTAAWSVSPSARRPARAGYAFLSNKYYLDALYENVIVRAIAHPDRQRRVLGQPARHRRRRQRRRPRRAQAPARGSTATSTRARRRRGQRRGHGRHRQRRAPSGPCSPARSTSTVRCSSAPPPSAPIVLVIVNV